MKTETIAHYISGTHWDREWYRPFEEYRLLLVQLVDELLDIMEEDGGFRYFQFDGQTCMLEDYLDIRPENRERLQQLIRDGRILIGPWFTMPDLFCPDGESLVRNLQLGRRIAGDWDTDPMPVGFICDMFGHPSQMPQIFAGFGIRDIVMGRGTNESTTDMYFEWLAPDGTRALTFKLQDKIGYGAFAHPRAILEGDSEAALQDLEDYGQFAEELTAAAHDPALVNKVREDWGRQSLGTYVNGEIRRANLPVIAVMDTMDHIMPAADVGRYLRLIHEASPGIAAHHSTLPQLFTDIRARREGTSLQKRRGEQREPSRDKCGYLYLIPNCVSARVRLKLAGDAAAGLLQRWAEPLLALAEGKNEDIRKMRPFLDRAWKLVLTNHAHDSVCGCSIDQVHRDMMNRFEQAQVLAEQLRHQAFAALTVGSLELARDRDDFTLTLFNPAVTPVDESVTFDIDLPTDYPASFHEGFRTQELKSFILEDAEGNTVPYQRMRVVPVMNERSRVAKHCFISDGAFARYTVAANLSLPACGYTSLRVRPAKRPVRTMGSLRTGPVSAANEHLAISIAPNGTLTLTDKSTGEVYRDLLTFEDRSELGDGWFHGESVNDAPALSSGAGAQVRVLHDGPEIVTFRIELTLAVPKRYNWHTEAPVEETVPLHIRSDVSLRRGAQVVDVTTTIENTAEDHRLQLLLPSDASDAQTYLAHTAFDLVARSISLDPATSDWQEAEIVEKPFESIQAVGQKNRGLAFLSGGGLHEGGVRDDQRRTMQVTLLRSFRRTVGTEGETDGLELGTITCRYAIMPYAAALPAAAAFRETLRLQAGILTRQTGKRPSGYPPLTGTDQKHTRSFLTLDGDLLLSGLKPAESGSGSLILRFWNPADTPCTGTLRFHQPVSDAVIVRLDEEPCAESADLAIDSHAVTLVAAPHRIVTISVRLAG